MTDSQVALSQVNAANSIRLMMPMPPSQVLLGKRNETCHGSSRKRSKTVRRDKMVSCHNDKLCYLVLGCYVIVMSLFKSEAMAQSRRRAFAKGQIQARLSHWGSRRTQHDML